MSVELVAILAAILLLVLLIACEVPIAFALGSAGTTGLLILGGVSNAGSWLGSLPYSQTAIYTLTLVPMFILMGLFAGHSGLLDEVFDLAYRMLRRLRGGLAAASSLAGVFFGGISGSSVADAATIGRLAIGEMSKRGYDKAFAAAVVAAGGTAAILIPPSIILVIYGILTGESIGKLLLAGIIPGVLTAIVEITVIVIVAPKYMTAVPAAAGGGDPFSSGPRTVVRGGRTIRRWRYFGPFLALLLMFTVLGGIYTGVFTATEAGAVGAGASLVCATLYVLRRQYEGTAKVTMGEVVRGALRETGGLTATVFALLVGGTIFTRFLILADVPQTVTDWILSLPVAPHVVVALFLLMLLPLGCLLDGLSLLLIVTPLAYPVVTSLGFDGIWLGILLVKLIEIGLITPPVGLNVFVVSGLFKDLPVERVFARVTPFVVSDLILVAILFSFPTITTWLPNLSQATG